MKFSFSEVMCDPSHLLPLATVADEAGYHSFGIPDSICYPDVAADDYPYTGDGDRSFLENAPFIDPFQLAAAMGAVTERIVFTTGVLKLPIRNPVLVAKQVTSIAALTGNRFVLGVGLSPWIEDFIVCAEDWKTRGKRMSQMIEIIQGLMAGDYFEYHSEYYDIPRIKLCPVPTEPVKILIGGHSEPAYRRAARLTDGFIFTGVAGDELVQRIEQLNSYRKEYGRANQPFEIHTGAPTPLRADDIKRLEDVGVTQLGVGARNAYEPDTLTLQDKIDVAKKFADEVIAKF